jgi:alkylhydroperoxidase/carboxymuconolactone decarboxylase family protein YurZ
LSHYDKLKTQDILPLIAASAALRKMLILRRMISLAKNRKISFIKIYETLLQNYLFAGYPSAIISLKVLKSYHPEKQIPKSEDMNLYHFRNRGELNCRRVYGNKYEKLLSNISNFSPDLSEWLVLEGYGKVLGRRGLSFKERELCIVAVLSALKFEDQLYSHIIGAFRANASVTEIKSVIENLNFLGRKNLSAFGLKVFKKFENEKGMR